MAAAVLVPLALGAGVLASAVREVVDDIRAMLEGRGSVPGILLGAHPPQAWTLQDWADVTSRYGANAWGAVTTIARASASAILGAFVFLVALFTSLRTASVSTHGSSATPQCLGRCSSGSPPRFGPPVADSSSAPA